METDSYFGVCSNPVRGLAIIITLLDPSPQPDTLDRVMPVLTAGKTERRRRKNKALQLVMMYHIILIAQRLLLTLPTGAIMGQSHPYIIHRCNNGTKSSILHFIHRCNNGTKSSMLHSIHQCNNVTQSSTFHSLHMCNNGTVIHTSHTAAIMEHIQSYQTAHRIHFTHRCSLVQVQDRHNHQQTSLSPLTCRYNQVTPGHIQTLSSRPCPPPPPN